MGRLHGCSSVRPIEAYLHSACNGYLNNVDPINHSTVRERKGRRMCRLHKVAYLGKLWSNLLPSADSMGSHPSRDIHEA